MSSEHSSTPVVIGLVACCLATQVGCAGMPATPGEFRTSHIAQVNGTVLDGFRAPQESVTVSTRVLRQDAAYTVGVGVSDRYGAFSLQIERIEASDRPEPDTLSVMLLLRALGSKYSRAPDGGQLTDSISVIVQFARVGKPTPVAVVSAVFRGLSSAR